MNGEMASWGGVFWLVIFLGMKGGFTKGWIAYLLSIHNIFNKILNSKSTDLDWKYSRPYEKLK